jgi:Icc-related predicted phosphoesterase
MLAKIMSDTHNDHHKLNVGSCDLLIHCGDAGTKGNLTEALDFLWWFNKQNAKYKLVVWGNHDKKAKEHPDAIKLAKDLGIIVLSNNGIEIEGLKIYGVDKTFKGVNDQRAVDHPELFASTEDRINAWKDIPAGLDLLITHMPPLGILDLVTHKDEHIGCPQLLAKIREVQPDFHFFGHVHEQAGLCAVDGKTKLFNMACKNRAYELVSDFYEFVF